MTTLLGFVTSPSMGSMVLCALVLGAAWLLFIRSGRVVDPPRVTADTSAHEDRPIPDDAPAVVNLITNGYAVTPDAAVATLLDLAARDWLSIDELGDDVVVLTNRHGHQGDQLTPYEQQVLNHVHSLTTGAVSGVSGAGVQIAGLRLSWRWRQRFEREVVAAARRLGYSHRRWDWRALGPPAALWVVAGLLLWRLVVTGDDIAINRSVFERSLSVALLGVAVWLGAKLLAALVSHHERPTLAGLDRAEAWLGVRQSLDREGIGQYSSVMSRNGDRRLAYAAAMGLAETAATEVPVMPEDNDLAWSDAAGSWRTVRVRYPLRPAYGRHPVLVLVVGLILTIGGWLLQRYLVRVSRSEALQSLADDFPDQADLIRNIALTLAAVLTIPLVLAVWTVLAGAVDSVLSVHRQGLVVRARRPERIVPFRKLLGPLARRDRYSLYVAVDNGTSPTVVAWLANERTAVPQGARAHVVATPILGYIRRSEPVGTTESR